MFVAFFAVGEGWHNYHHAFPWDYRASELGSPLNITGFLIDLLAQVGLVYDRKEATHNMVKNRVYRTGDKSHKVYGTDEGRRAFKTLFNIWRHPSNPTYNSLFAPKPKIINSEGYALIPDELAKSEMDEDLLSKENEQLEKEHLKGEGNAKYGDNNNLIVKLTKLMGDGMESVNGMDKNIECNNNVTCASRNCIPRDKSELNVDEVLLVKL